MKKLGLFYLGGAMGLSALLPAPAWAVPAFVDPNLTAGSVAPWKGFGTAKHSAPGSGFFLKGSGVAGVDQKVGSFKTGDVYLLSFKETHKGTNSLRYGALVVGLAPTQNRTHATFKATKASYTLGAFGQNKAGLGTYHFTNFFITDISVPEVDPTSGAAPVALALGGLALMADRRRKEKEVG